MIEELISLETIIDAINQHKLFLQKIQNRNQILDFFKEQDNFKKIIKNRELQEEIEERKLKWKEAEKILELERKNSWLNAENNDIKAWIDGILEREENQEKKKEKNINFAVGIFGLLNRLNLKSIQEIAKNFDIVYSNINKLKLIEILLNSEIERDLLVKKAKICLINYLWGKYGKKNDSKIALKKAEMEVYEFMKNYY